MKIDSYNAACAALGIDPNYVPDTSGMLELFKASHIADYKLMVWIEASNKDNPADFTNTNQVKYEPYFEWSASAGAFVYYDFADWVTRTLVGARLCFTELADLKSAVENPEFMQLINDKVKRPN